MREHIKRTIGWIILTAVLVMVSGCATVVAPRPAILQVQSLEPAGIVDIEEPEEAPAEPVLSDDGTASGYIYTIGHDRALRKVDLGTGAVLWEFTGHGSWVAGLSMDDEGYLYTAGGDARIRKIDPADGSVVWVFSGHGNGVNEVVAGNGFIYTAAGGSDGHVKKLTLSGEEVWTYRVTEGLHGLAVDQEGNVYAGSSTGRILKLDGDGKLLWTYKANHVNELVVDAAGDLYDAGGNGNGLLKLSPAGEKLWNTTDFDGNVTYVTLGADGSVLTADASGAIKKIDPQDGSIISEFTGIDEVIFGIAEDTDGLVYAGSKSGILYCIDMEAGSVLWSDGIHTDKLRAIVLAGSRVPGTPAGQLLTDDGLVPPEPQDTVAPAVYTVGDTGPAGGIIAYVNPESSDDWTYIEAAPSDWAGTEEDPSYHWGGRSIKISEVRIDTSDSGLYNTKMIISYLSSVEQEPYAAEICDALVFGGYDDWYLPSRGELYILYESLASKGLGNFMERSYLSSTEVNSLSARSVSMEDGDDHAASKTANVPVRPIRRF